MDEKKTEETGSSEKNFYEIQKEKTLEAAAPILESKSEEASVQEPKPEERVAYLALSDPRYATIATQVIREAQHKFLKLYKKTPDKGKRDLGAEMVVWISHMTLVHLTMLEQNKKMGNATAVFLQAFEHMLKIKQAEIEELKQLRTESTEVTSNGDATGDVQVAMPGTEQPAQDVRPGDPEQHQA